jgi:hypothetical protein
MDQRVGQERRRPGRVQQSARITFVPGSADLLVADRENSRLQLFDRTGVFKNQWTGVKDAQTTGRVFSVAADSAGFYYVGIRRADYDTGRRALDMIARLSLPTRRPGDATRSPSPVSRSRVSFATRSKQLTARPRATGRLSQDAAVAVGTVARPAVDGGAQRISRCSAARERTAARSVARTEISTDVIAIRAYRSRSPKISTAPTRTRFSGGTSPRERVL